MNLKIDPNNLDDYRLFLRIKQLPLYSISGRTAWVPDEYGDRLGATKAANVSYQDWTAPDWFYDYQRDVTKLAIRKRRFAVFMECGLGKTPILLEFARYAAAHTDGCILIVSPLMVINQTLAEAARFYSDYPIEQIPASKLHGWLNSGKRKIGITNYEAIRPNLKRGRLSGLILDESSLLKSHYGKWGTKLIELGKGLEWKLCCTGTPAPNDRIEYANHAVFLNHFPTVNSFLARFFVNRGQTQERWELKPHALKPFYRALSHWSIFVTNPATYGWKDNTENIPPINVVIHDVPLTNDQRKIVEGLTGQLFVSEVGGIVNRSRLAQIAKGNHKGVRVATHKPEFIRRLVESWPEESTIIWCLYNAEQDSIERVFPDAASIRGDTPYEERMSLIGDFQAGRRKVLVSKPRVLGFGLNLQAATRQVFSGLQDSYESFHQAVKRSNRIGSTRPLHVHIPVMDIERPGVESVLRKAAMVQRDTEEQEAIFKECCQCF